MRDVISDRVRPSVHARTRQQKKKDGAFEHTFRGKRSEALCAWLLTGHLVDLGKRDVISDRVRPSVHARTRQQKKKDGAFEHTFRGKRSEALCACY